mmetsp:Transcript_18146/g.45074  ORF Transcript_18146/g.45074 Transcript_18146/m.45074 type:complete len:220 (-) Transcript_18146:29-688(-)
MSFSSSSRAPPVPGARHGPTPRAGGARRGGNKRSANLRPGGQTIKFRVRARLVESKPTWMDNTEDAQESIIIEPRMTFGLDVHRRVHMGAMRQLAYQSQWRAYCQRSARDWRDAVTDEDETVLCSFHFELEQGLTRFEAAKAAGELGAWPPRTLHPTQGLPAIDAALKGAVTGVCQGQERLFKLVPQESDEGVQGMGGSRVGSESEPQGTRNNDTNPRP